MVAMPLAMARTRPIPTTCSHFAWLSTSPSRVTRVGVRMTQAIDVSERMSCKLSRMRDSLTDLDGNTQVCVHGDPTCPCQDGDWCHYIAYPEAPTPEGQLAMRCPTTGIIGCEACTRQAS